MITVIKNWWYDYSFYPTLRPNPVGIKNAYWWRAPSHPAIDLKSEIQEWLNEQVEGKYCIDFPSLFLSPSSDPREVECIVYFSRPADAIKFKLSFS